MSNIREEALKYLNMLAPHIKERHGAVIINKLLDELDRLMRENESLERLCSCKIHPEHLNKHPKYKSLEAKIADLQQNSNVQIVEVWMKKVDELEKENASLEEVNKQISVDAIKLESKLSCAVSALKEVVAWPCASWHMKAAEEAIKKIEGE